MTTTPLPTITALARDAASALDHLDASIRDAANEVGTTCRSARQCLAFDRTTAIDALTTLHLRLPPGCRESTDAYQQAEAVRDGYPACEAWADGWRKWAREQEESEACLGDGEDDHAWSAE